MKRERLIYIKFIKEKVTNNNLCIFCFYCLSSAYSQNIVIKIKKNISYNRSDGAKYLRSGKKINRKCFFTYNLAVICYYRTCSAKEKHDLVWLMPEKLEKINLQVTLHLLQQYPILFK